MGFSCNCSWKKVFCFPWSMWMWVLHSSALTLLAWFGPPPLWALSTFRHSRQGRSEMERRWRQGWYRPTKPSQLLAALVQRFLSYCWLSALALGKRKPSRAPVFTTYTSGFMETVWRKPVKHRWDKPSNTLNTENDEELGLFPAILVGGCFPSIENNLFPYGSHSHSHKGRWY